MQQRSVDIQDIQAFVSARRTLEPAVEGQDTSGLEFGGGAPVAPPQVLVLPEEARWLEPNAGSRMYVRPAFHVLWMLAGAFLEQQHAVVVTGAMGTGKSAFLSFVLHHELAHGSPPTIVFDMPGLFCRVGADGAVEDGARGLSFTDELQDRNTLYMCDASTFAPLSGPDVKARTLVAAAPTRRCIQSLDDPVTFVMPLWTTAELEICRASCFPNVSRDHFVELVHLWGGTARWTLGTPIETSKAQLKRSTDLLQLSTAVQLVRECGIMENSLVDDEKYSVDAQQLVHMDVGADNLFKLESVQLCSRAAVSLILRGLSNGEVLEALEQFGRKSANIIDEAFQRQVRQELAGREAFN